MVKFTPAARPVRAVLAVTCVLAALPSFAQQGTTLPTDSYYGHEVVANEVIIKFKPGVASRATVERVSDVDYSHGVGDGRILVMHSRSHTTEMLVQELAHRTDVVYVEPNYILHTDNTPNDTYFNLEWAMLNTGQSIQGTTGTAGADIDATLAWNISTGSRSVVTAVVDTGINYNHEDLAANTWSAPTSFNVTIGGVTMTCPAGAHGYNAVSNNFDPLDDNDHGSHTSGTIGAVGNNGIGVAGVNWTASVMACKFLNAQGSGSTTGAINAIEFAIQAKQALGSQANVRVLSNSWGGGGFSQALLDEINKANTNNMLFVAAAGNNSSNNDTTATYPADYSAPNIVAVAATDNKDQLASFSNYGASTVHLGAPGVNIASTVRSGYAWMSGTSMATPHVSGAAALLLAVNGGLTTAQVKSALLNTVDPISSLTGKTITGGRLNLYHALQSVGGGGATPDFSVSASPASQSVVQGSSTSYGVTVSPTNGFASDVTLSVTGLPAGAGGTFTVNPVTGGSGSSTLNVTTSSSTPTGTYNVVITGTGGGTTHQATVTLTVTAPATPDFTISASPSSQSIRRGASATYTVTITAQNGFAENVAFSVTGVPTGATAVFTPTSVPGSGSSSLRITTTMSTARGNFTLTITGTSASKAHSTTVQLGIHK